MFAFARARREKKAKAAALKDSQKTAKEAVKPTSQKQKVKDGVKPGAKE